MIMPERKKKNALSPATLETFVIVAGAPSLLHVWESFYIFSQSIRNYKKFLTLKLIVFISRCLIHLMSGMFASSQI